MVSSWKLRQAVSVLNAGGVIAYPTEAIYGLGCNPWDINAIRRILAIKKRPCHKGLILVAANFDQLHDFIQPVPEATLKKIKASWPGATTWLLPVRKSAPIYLSGKHDTIAVRVTAHCQTAELCQQFAGAIVSTSANIAGKPPAKTAHHVRLKLSGIDYLLPGPCSGASKPSTIKDARTGKIIR